MKKQKYKKDKNLKARSRRVKLSLNGEHKAYDIIPCDAEKLNEPCLYLKNFRVYKTEKSKEKRQAIGIWQGVKDNISFSYHYTIKEARQEAKNILANSTEICIAIEDITAKTLYIIYRDKTEILTEYIHIQAEYKKLYKRFKAIHKNYTLEKTKKGIIAYAYNHKTEKINDDKIKAPLIPKIFYFGTEVI